MKRKLITLMATILCLGTVLNGCGKADEKTESPVESFTGTLRILNIKSEVNDQIVALGKQYQQETGITVDVLSVPAGVDAQATLKWMTCLSPLIIRPRI